MGTLREDRVEADRQIVISHVVDAPRERVWAAFTDPRRLAQWWGPRGFTTETHSMRVEPGGEWRYVMHGPDGTDYGNRITYLEVVRPERLTYKHGGDKDCEPVNFQTAATFEEEGGGERTRVTLHMVFPSASAKDFVVKEYNAIEGGKQTLSRLGEHLAECAGDSAAVRASVAEGRPAPGGRRGGEDPFRLTRVFDAARGKVFEAWTDRGALEAWFGPKGMPVRVSTLDLRPGGLLHYGMQVPGGAVMWGRWVFREIVPGERLVFVASFSDEKAGVTRAPFNADWPLEVLSTVLFAEHAGKGRGTVVMLEAVPLEATEAERKAFAGAHDSLKQGWSGTLEQLAGWLAG